jgi:peroxin-16
MGATKGRTGVQPPVAEREMDPAVVEMNRERVARLQRVAVVQPTTAATTIPPPRSAADVLLRRAEGASDLEVGIVQAETEEKEFWTGTRTGVVRPTLASLRKEGGEGSEAAPWANMGTKDAGKEYLMNRVLTIEDVKRPQDLVAKAKGVKKLAEIIYILRPLIYGAFFPSLFPFHHCPDSRLLTAVLALRRYGRRHTLPYLLSLSLEYLAFSLRQSSSAKLASDKASGPMLPQPSPSELEKQETGKRGKQFWWYLMRGPVWESWTKYVFSPPSLVRRELSDCLLVTTNRPQLESIARKFDDKPLVGFVSTIITDYTPLFDEYYYCSSPLSLPLLLPN